MLKFDNFPHFLITFLVALLPRYQCFQCTDSGTNVVKDDLLLMLVLLVYLFFAEKTEFVKVCIDKELNTYFKHKCQKCYNPKNLTYVCTTKWAKKPYRNTYKIQLISILISRTKFLAFPSNFSEISCCQSLLVIVKQSMLKVC